ncbi:MAG: exodeoxyribonuclease VII large subunit [Clostridia bacterium]|nr:MAG: exodeoxyribonuclease VII large subunit [Clostridia bacterium]
MMGRRAVSVSELTAYLKKVLAADPFLQQVWVRGEVSNLRQPTSGHIYFTLKDEQAALRCVMFWRQSSRLRFPLANGLQVVAGGYVDVYARDGQYQLYIQQVYPAGAGEIFLNWQELKDRLEKEGLFATGRKRPLPAWPRKVGLATSPTGAAVRDMITIMQRRCPQVEIILSPCAVQGLEAPEQICAAIDRLCRWGVDVIIVGRGGGSWEELAAFNDEAVVRTVAGAGVPVVSAVGHETDYTLTDLAADVRAPTPSAAAEMVVPNVSEVLVVLRNLGVRLQAAMDRNLEQKRLRLQQLAAYPVLTRPQRYVDGLREDVDRAGQQLGAAMRLFLERKRQAWTQMAGQLESLNPLAVLRRGYAVCKNDRGEVITAAGSIQEGEEVEVLLHRGRLGCLVRSRYQQ